MENQNPPNNRNRPVKLFQKRENTDDRSTQGFKSEILPKWASIPIEIIEAKASMIQGVMKDAIASFDERSDDRKYIPAIVKVQINEQALAKSYRSDIGGIFNLHNEYNLIGFTDEYELLVKVNNTKDAQTITERLNRPERHLIGVAAISEIDAFEPFVEIDTEKLDASKALRVKLINYKNVQLNAAVERTFESVCFESDLQFRKINYAPGLVVYRLSNATADSIKEIEDFEALESLTFMPKYEVTLDDVRGAVEEVEIKIPQEGVDYPIVGILDSGISSIAHLKPWILDEKFKKIPDDRINPAHGTFVAGVVIYGDQLEGQNYTGVEGCYLYDATVFTDYNNEIEEGDLIEHVREAIEKRPDIKIWNLSLGTATESDLNNFSFFGISLDSIQAENEILICKSAGNCTNFLRNTPVSRISRSADSVRSLVVGSVSNGKGKYEIAEPYHPSPFSRIGKGPSNINKPDITHVGGNAGVHPVTKRVAFEGVRSFAPDGSISRNVGTSFSTPRVTSLAAGLQFNINEDFNPLLLKALLIHRAKYPDTITLPIHERIKQMGFGIPTSLEEMIYNDPNEITLIMQDTLEKGKFIEMHDFPFPTNLIDKGYFTGEITITLVTSPVLDFDQGSEYCQSNMNIMFGTYDRFKEKFDKNGKPQRNPIGLEGNANLLNDQIYGTRFRVHNVGEFARERTLLKYGDKYQPVKKFAINLEEMTPSNKEQFLPATKKWYLKLEGLYRDFIIADASAKNQGLSQEFCLIITIRDKKGNRNVYDQVTRLLNDNNFIHSNINLRGDNQIRLGN